MMLTFFVKSVLVVVEQLSDIGVMTFTAESDDEASYANLEKSYVDFSTINWETLTFDK